MQLSNLTESYLWAYWLLTYCCCWKHFLQWGEWRDIFKSTRTATRNTKHPSKMLDVFNDSIFFLWISFQFRKWKKKPIYLILSNLCKHFNFKHYRNSTFDFTKCNFNHNHKFAQTLPNCNLTHSDFLADRKYITVSFEQQNRTHLMRSFHCPIHIYFCTSLYLIHAAQEKHYPPPQMFIFILIHLYIYFQIKLKRHKLL